jgi:transposase
MKREEIQAAYATGPEAVVALVEGLLAAHQTQVAELTARIEHLEARLNQDSHNSHKPPSSDGPAKLPPRRSRRKRSGKRSGGQVGHPGVTLTQTEQPDTVVPHRASTCSRCQASLASAAVVGCERRQVVDLPPTRPQVTEHQALQLCCPQCQTVTVGQFPADVTQPAQYGSGVKALAVYLQEYQHLPFERTQEFFRDVFNLPLSEGTLARARETCAARLEGVETAIKQALIQAPVVNFDETGLRIDGQTHWLHSAGTPDWTYYAVHPQRGHSAMDAIGLLPVFHGTAVHDALPAYFQYQCQHSLCNAHLLRDLTAVSETTRQHWPQLLTELLLKIKTAVARARDKGQIQLSPRQRHDFSQHYQHLVQQGLRSNSPPKRTGQRGRPAQGPIRSLLLRLKNHSDAVLAFMYDFRVPFDNNLAERDLRMAKVRQKVAGCFRSWRGAEIFCRIRGYLSTMRKQGHNALAALTTVFAGHPCLPRLAAE